MGGKVYAVNWSRVVNAMGVTDSEIQISPDTVSEWSGGGGFLSSVLNQEPGEEGYDGHLWLENHRLPKQYAVNPVYLYFSGDPAVFYTEGALSYIHPTSGSVNCKPEDIVWKVDGKEVSRGWFFDLGALDETVDKIPDGSGGFSTIMQPKTVKV